MLDTVHKSIEKSLKRLDAACGAMINCLASIDTYQWYASMSYPMTFRRVDDDAPSESWEARVDTENESELENAKQVKINLGHIPGVFSCNNQAKGEFYRALELYQESLASTHAAAAYLCRDGVVVEFTSKETAWLKRAFHLQPSNARIKRLLDKYSDSARQELYKSTAKSIVELCNGVFPVIEEAASVAFKMTTMRDGAAHMRLLCSAITIVRQMKATLVAVRKSLARIRKEIDRCPASCLNESYVRSIAFGLLDASPMDEPAKE